MKSRWFKIKKIELRVTTTAVKTETMHYSYNKTQKDAKTGDTIIIFLFKREKITTNSGI